MLDFGCGVGRLSLPFARRCQSVVGVDISAAMLTEATANAERAGLTNVKFVSSDDQLSRVEGEFDMIHSFIVLQHIVPRRGEKLIGELIDRLAADGVGILHVTYANASRTPLVRRLMTTAYERVPLANGARNVLKGEHFGKPTMHMHRYDLSRVMRVLQERGCDDVHVRFTEAIHYRYPIYGAILIFRKRVLNPGMYS
ncbi:MAG: class I SAM-dependent methyltransferase [Ilumatobacteraceae bacterium]